MSIERTDAVIARYMDGDRTVIAEHAVYTDMGSGERFEGRDAIDTMFERFYRKAFDVKPEDTRRVVGDGYAMYEASLVGRHVGEYAGVPATGATVRIPMCVTFLGGSTTSTGRNDSAKEVDPMGHRICLDAGIVIAYQRGSHTVLQGGVVVLEDDRIVHVGHEAASAAGLTTSAA